MLLGFNAVAVGIADPLPELFLDLCSMNYFIFWTKLFQLFRVVKTCHYGFQRQDNVLIFGSNWAKWLSSASNWDTICARFRTLGAAEVGTLFLHGSYYRNIYLN